MAENVEKTTVIVEIGLKPILILLGILLLFYVLFLVRDVLFILFLSGMLASAIYPVVNHLKERRFPRIVSILILYFLLVVFLVCISILMGTLLVEQGRQFIHQLPAYVDSAMKYLSQIPFFPKRFHFENPITQNTEAIVNQLATILQSTMNYVFLVISGLLGIFTVFVLTFYLTIDMDYFKKITFAVLPERIQPVFQEIIVACINKIGKYVRGQLILMLAVGFLVWLGLTLLGIPNALVLALIAFSLEIVPILGPIVSAFFGILVALGQSPMMAVWVALFYLFVQQSESYFLTPKIFGNSVELHPFWIFVSILIGGSFAGLPGVILAIPSAVIISILIQELYVQRFLKKVNIETLK